MSTVTVIVVNYNGGGDLHRCLTALAGQTRQAERVVVVDNASSDGSLDGVEQDFPGVTLIRNSENLGFAAANNLAVRDHADTQWVALLNPDAWPEPDWLDALMTAAARHPECVAFGSRQLRASDPDILDGTGDRYHLCGKAWRRDEGVRVADGHLRSGEIFSPCAAAALYRRDAFWAVEGFDEDFFCYFEDVDLGFRLRLAGGRCWYAAEAVVRHVGSGSTARFSDFALYHTHRNMVWCFVRNMPPRLFWRYLPLHILYNLLTALHWTARGRGRVMLRAKLDAIKGLARAWRKRSLQKQQTGPDMLLFG